MRKVILSHYLFSFQIHVISITYIELNFFYLLINAMRAQSGLIVISLAVVKAKRTKSCVSFLFNLRNSRAETFQLLIEFAA